MKTRPLRSEDIPTLREFYTASGFAYDFPDLSRMEAVVVVADEDDRPIMAVAAEKLVQLYLLASKDGHPATKLHAIRLLHSAMSAELIRLGYNGAEAFIPPSIASVFGRRLERTFGWVKNWRSWTIKLNG
jgi:hypothetical protein